MRSIAMATFQGMPYIREQMESILGQLASDDEVVVSDNGSTDGTDLYVKELAEEEPRIRFFRYSEKIGVQANFENALKQCRGELIFLCDQDDIWLENRMNTITGFFSENPKLLAVQVDAELIDRDGRILAPSFFALRNAGRGILKNIYKNTWQGCNMAIRRSLLDLALPFPNSIPMHDMWLGILADIAGEVLFFRKVLSRYRRHGDNKSALKPAGWIRVILWRLRLGFALTARARPIWKYRKLLEQQVSRTQ